MIYFRSSTAEYRAETRYQACQVLRDHKIPRVVWFEDALHYYDVPTVVFDLYILVPDIDTAADCLVKAGWLVDTQGRPTIGNAYVDLPQRRLVSPDGHTKTVLLPAVDWKFSLTADSSLEHSLFPPLSGFLDALIESWLDCPVDDSFLLLHLAGHISYLYAHNPALKKRSFAEQLKYEHRQFHYDVLAGMSTGTVPFRRHERPIRDALLRGQYQLQEEGSASCDNEDLFTAAREARLLASIRAQQAQQNGDSYPS